MSLINYFDLPRSTKTFSNNDLCSLWQQIHACKKNDIILQEYVRKTHSFEFTV